MIAVAAIARVSSTWAHRSSVYRHNWLLASGRHCRSPDLHLDLGGTTLTLKAEDYAGPSCAPMLAPTKDEWPTKPGTFVLGEPFLKRYYTAFDWEHMRIGFGKATGTLDNVHTLVDDEEDDLTAVTAGTASPETRTIVLLQVKFQRTKFVDDDDD